MKKLTLIALTAALILSCFSYLQSQQTGSVAGTVTDAKTGQAISGAAVKILNSQFSAFIDNQGKYLMANVPAGKYSLQASAPNYDSQIKKNITVKAGATLTVDFKLKPPVPAKDENNRLALDKAMKCSEQAAAPCMSIGSGMVYRGVPADFNTEEYSKIDENTFKQVKADPLSTFSIDVDPASYANMRRFLNSGQLPPKDAVRIEELINYFDYAYAQPDDGRPFAVHTEAAECPWNQGHRLVRIGLKGKEIALDKLPPTNLVFLLDVSGSMQDPAKLPLLKSAFKLLVNQLRPQDRVAIAVYASAEGLALPSTPGSDKKTILGVLDQLEAGGCTAGAAGIQLAYKTAKENFIKNGNNRVILATDGDFNVGVSSTSELIRMIEQKREEGIYLSVLGFGAGNLKDSRMEQLADKGNGNYAYIDNITEARKVLVSQMGGTLFTIAKDVKIQVEFNPARVKAYKLIGYENRLLNKEDFNDDKKDAGELGSGHTVTALYEIIPAGSQEEVPGVDPLKYQETKVSSAASKSPELMTVKLRYKLPAENESKLISKVIMDRNGEIAESSEDFRFAAAVAEFGLLIRDSEFKGKSSYGQALALARGAKGQDKEGYRAEFIKLAETARLLAQNQD
ncbi:von Willebrand factor type A domain-containing protein [candidate division TA06 bacterium]|uniref:von Willebrand factor type A domain-containing protein n=1 Tax=candidate division TA06 bacterium TaxID=2250710 RepID=A0A933I9I3_UNCT6|nr:von Willebrand factor type A domain-containing protein [candidate division TA06 bacterium]